MISHPRTLLAILTALNFVNYLDRFLVAAVLQDIQQELKLSNTEGGLLATIFLVGFFLTSPLFGILGDRLPRKWLLAFGIVLWSLATICSGLAINAATLLFTRAFVGVGEASFTTLAPTIIDDIAPSKEKTRWQSFFQMAAPIGSALGFIFGGLVEKYYGWRAVFFGGGSPGLLLFILIMLMREPTRKIRMIKSSLILTVKELWPNKTYVRAVLGYAALMFCIGGFAHWAPSFLSKRFAFDQAIGNVAFGVTTVISGLIATFVGGILGDKKNAKFDDKTTSENRSVAFLEICGLGAMFGAPLTFATFFAPHFSLFFFFGFFAELGIFLSNGPINLAIFRAVPEELRASAMALAIFCIHLFGDLISPTLVGMLVDLFGDSQIKWAMFPLPLALGFSAICWRFDWTKGLLKNK